MSLVNFTTREITCKIVYYGPGRSGKTTNLHYIYGRVPDARRGRMVSLATQTDRTLFFDFLPDRPRADLGLHDPVPALHRAGPGLLQRDAQAWCCRAPTASCSWPTARRASSTRTSRACRTCRPTCSSRAWTSATMPIVLQYNKQDLPRELILQPLELDDALNFRARAELSRRRAARERRVRDAEGRSPSWCCAGWRRGRPRDDGAQPEVPLRHLRGGRGQPAGRHGRPHRRREPRVGLQPALHLQRVGARQDAPADGDRRQRRTARARARASST